MPKIENITSVLRRQLVDNESLMKHWNYWRSYIAEGGRGSWPRDQFEMLLSSLDGEREIAELEALPPV